MKYIMLVRKIAKALKGCEVTVVTNKNVVFTGVLGFVFANYFTVNGVPFGFKEVKALYYKDNAILLNKLQERG